MKLTVVHLEGSKQGQTEHLPGPVIAIGRDPASNQLAFDPFKDLDVSTNHASVTFQGDQVMLQDLGSRNGTFLNGVKVAGAVPLPNDSVVQFGEKGPKVKLTYIFHSGPGKKTQMIQDLSDKLAGAEEEKKKSKSRNVLLATCFFFLLLFGGLGVFLYSSSAKKKALKAEVEALKTDELPRARAKAEGMGAAGEATAKGDWEAAVAAVTAAEAAEQDEAWDQAKAQYALAVKKFDAAGEAATLAQLTALRSQATAAGKMAEDAAKKREEDQKNAEEALRKAKEEEERRLAELIRRLSDAAKIKENLRALEGSTNPDELKGAVDALQKALAENPDDPALKEQLEKFQAQLQRAENVGEDLTKAASEAKAKVVGIRARVFAIPAGQRVDTTKIRIPIADSHGTGFFASASGHIVTAKEVVEPHNFDPAALALQTKLREKGMQVLTDLEVMTATAGIYTTTYTGARVAVVRRFNDSVGAEAPVTIPFDNAQVEVKVRPHRRDESDVVILKVDGLTDQPYLQLGQGEPAAGLPLVVLGTQQGGDGLESSDQVGLFLFQGKVVAAGKRMELDAPSFRSWIGGPVIDANGKVVGLLVAEGTDKSKALAPSVFKAELD
ncbi:MAG: FHA domain-containing protein [Planctomycetes bacterium]|nr:FHA domain-containing protein [Planctomycetota bacterium]